MVRMRTEEVMMCKSWNTVWIYHVYADAEWWIADADDLNGANDNNDDNDDSNDGDNDYDN